jgi:hypothetical protein
MNEIQSVTGRDVPHITLTKEDRGWLWSYLYPFAALPNALRHGDWFEVAFWLIGIAGFTAIARFGQSKGSRTTPQKVFFVVLEAIAASLVLIPAQHQTTSSIVGLVIAPIPFIVDVVLARSRRSGPAVATYTP